MHKQFERLPDEPTIRWRSFDAESPTWLIPPDELLSQREEQREEVAQERELLRCLPKALSLLTAKERFVVERHFGLRGTEASFTAIGFELHISKQRAGQLWKSARKRLGETLNRQEEIEND